MVSWNTLRKSASETLSQLLHVFGVLWILVEPGIFFIGEKNATYIRQFWWLFLIIGFAMTICKLRKNNRFSFKVTNKDINVELVIGDIFKQDGSIIVGSNTSFITSKDVISPKSIQGSFTSRYFNGVDAINDQIRGQICPGEHPIGTIVKVESKERVGYFCAIADINESGVAESSIEQLRVALAELWSYLSANAEKDTLNVPILGSGFSRIGSPREDLFKEIVRSFNAAISDRTFCDVLRIVVLPGDVRKHSIDVHEMARYLDYSCSYAIGFGKPSDLGTAEDYDSG